MTKLRTLWRRFGSLLAAVLTLMLVVPTSVDAALCVNEEPSVVSALAAGYGATATSADPDAAVQKRLGAPGCLCQHGHCHQASLVPPCEADAARTEATEAALLRPWETPERRSRQVTRLERPPRA